jgi:D-alanyl-lipoteichoic acid acyltransferase DltB (MBOAT superfamily)
MIFHSLDFLVFLAVTVGVYWRLPHRAQNVFLLAASYLFYGYVHPWFLILIGISTLMDYGVALAIEASPTPARRRSWLWVSLAGNLGMLAGFKYFGFFVDNVWAALDAFGMAPPKPALHVVLPVGISFYTFQTLSYTIDVYRGTLRARRRLVDVALFVAFFPQLVAGPIERASHLLPQVERPRTFDWTASRAALVLIVWGFFKKLVIADNVGVIADKVFSLQSPSFEVLWAGVFAFGMQIFADFSAYSDIARGTARWLGFDIMKNFHHPYLARGPVDFWRRWHISLSTWFRDYVYIPIGGSRRGVPRTFGNIMITFLLSGFWHGANWNFVLWGAYHGVLLVASRVAATVFPRAGAFARRLALVLTPLRIVLMFVLVHIGWLMFRESNLGMLVRDLTLTPAASTVFDRQMGLYLFLLAAAYSLPLWLHALWDTAGRRIIARAPWLDVTQPLPWAAVQGVTCGLLFAVLLVFRSRTSLDFIYFQF